jgi:hypothetical protein
LHNKLAELYSLLDCSLYKADFDIIFVCETWLNEIDSDGLLLYNNLQFTVLRHDRPSHARGGGVCIFVRNRFNFSRVSFPAAYEHLEVICIDTISQDYKQRFICVYRPPNYDVVYITALVECLNGLLGVDLGTICY